MEKLLPQVDWHLPNDAEAGALTGKADPLKAIQVFRSWGAHGIIVTLGDRGALALFENEYWRCEAYPWQAVDPSGAGDAFASGLITEIVKDWTFSRSLQYASALGGSAARMVGTTDGVLTDLEAEHLVDEQPVAVSRENPEAAL